jgi:hypothetical protein
MSDVKVEIEDENKVWKQKVECKFNKTLYTSAGIYIATQNQKLDKFFI